MIGNGSFAKSLGKKIVSHVLHGCVVGESFQDCSWIQDFEDDFPLKVILKMLN